MLGSPCPVLIECLIYRWECVLLSLECNRFTEPEAGDTCKTYAAAAVDVGEATVATLIAYRDRIP